MSRGVFPLMSGASTFTPWSNRNFRILVREEKKKNILVKEEKKKDLGCTSNRKRDWKKVPWPGFEPGLLRPQRNVLTSRRSRLSTLQAKNYRFYTCTTLPSNNKYFELKKPVGRWWGAPNSNYLLVMVSTFVMPFSMDPLSLGMTPGCITQK